MTGYGIKLLALGSSGPLFEEPLWVVSFDPDVHGEGYPYPTGNLVTTIDPADALPFDTFSSAFEFARQQSTVFPTRPDGEPNRPLTAFTVEIGRLPEPSGTSPPEPGILPGVNVPATEEER